MSVVGVRFDGRVLEEMRAHAVAEHPYECCGMGFGPVGEAGVVTRVVHIRNVQNELNQSDPEKHPRDARTAYFMDVVEQDAAMRAATEDGLELRALYHSHPDHGAYFSAEDRRMAAPEGWGELYPGVAYIVLSVTSTGVVTANQFVFDAGAEDYAEIRIDALHREADRVLELGAEPVPQSLVRARDELRRMNAGEVLEVKSSDRESLDDAIPGYCEKQRFPVDRIVDESGVAAVLRITKTA